LTGAIIIVGNQTGWENQPAKRELSFAGISRVKAQRNEGGQKASGAKSVLTQNPNLKPFNSFNGFSCFSHHSTLPLSLFPSFPFNFSFNITPTPFRQSSSKILLAVLCERAVLFNVVYA